MTLIHPMKTNVTIEKQRIMFQEGGEPYRYLITVEYGNNWEYAFTKEHPTPFLIEQMTRRVEEAPQSNNPRRVPKFDNHYPFSV